jgi:signal transduction histidine kinase
LSASIFQTATLLFISLILSLFHGTIILLHARYKRNRSGLYLGLALLSFALSLMLFVVQNGLPPILASLVPNLALISSFVLYEFGFSTLLERPLKKLIPLTLLALNGLGLIIGTYVWNSFAMRTIIVQGTILTFVLRVAFLALREYTRFEGVSIRTFGYAGLFLSLSPLFRIIFVLADPRVTAVAQDTFINALIFFTVILLNSQILAGYFEMRQVKNLFKRSKQHEAEEQLLENQRFLNRVISHDLNGPISSLSNLLKEVQSSVIAGKLPDTQMMDVLVDVSASSQMLLRNVSDLGKYQLKRALPAPRDVLLAPIFWSAVEDADGAARQRHIEVIQELEEGLVGHCDQNGLQAVLRNLLLFFIENSPENKFVILQARRSRYDDATIHISIKNQSDGLSEDRLIELNQQLEQTPGIHSKRENSSTISSMVVLTICRELGWDIEFSNAPEGGLKTDLKIPATEDPELGAAAGTAVDA